MPEIPTLLHETPDWLVLDKPAGWHSVRGATAAGEDGSGVVEAWLAANRPELTSLPESGLVHRLDRDTSGCLLVARTSAARERLAARFRTGDGVRKIYLARIRSGLPAAGDATRYFTSRYTGSARVTVSGSGEARHAGHFRWRVLARDDARGDLVEVELVGPGRRHEIRAGCANLGHPLVGDALYGGEPAPAVQLHAWRVEIDGVRVEAPPPAWAHVE